jgi:hypothetical protein
MRDWLTNDFYWKSFSVVMAIGIWLTVHTFSGVGTPGGLLSSSNIYTNIPVTIVSSTPGANDVSLSPEAVTVTVSGSPEMMAAFDAERLHAYVNLTGIDAAHDLTRRVDVATQPHVTILNINPPTVTVTLPK